MVTPLRMAPNNLSAWTEENEMDFLTGMAYWGILVLVLVNAVLVSRMTIEIRQEEDDVIIPKQEERP